MKRKEWEPDPKGVEAAMKSWCNFAGTSDDPQPCKHCIEIDFLVMLEAYLEATGYFDAPDR